MNTIIPKGAKPAQTRQSRILRDVVRIPHYWVVGGVVITNLSNAQEYKNEAKSTR